MFCNYEKLKISMANEIEQKIHWSKCFQILYFCRWKLTKQTEIQSKTFIEIHICLENETFKANNNCLPGNYLYYRHQRCHFLSMKLIIGLKYRFPSLFAVDTFRHFGPQILNWQIKIPFLTRYSALSTDFASVNMRIHR